MKHHIIITATVTLALLLTNIDITTINIAIPVLTQEFGIPVDTSVLIIITYLLAIAGTLLIFGRLNDMGYANHLFTLGFWVFLVASVLCALSWNFMTLLIFRFIQGIGGAMFLSTYAIIIKTHVASENLGKAYGIIGVAAGAGYTVGLFLGGLILTYFSWRMIFIINIPVCIAGIICCQLFLEKNAACRVPGAPFDYRGAVLGFVSFACLVYGLHLAYEDYRFNICAVWWLVAALLFLTAFFYSQKTSPAPLLDLSIIKNKPVCLILMSTVCFLVVENVGCLLLPLYFTEAMEFTLIRTSHLLIAPALVTLVFSPLSGYFVDRLTARRVSIISAMTFFCGTAALATFHLQVSITYIVVILLFYGVMISLFSAAIMTYLMQHATPESMGTITSLKSLLPIVFGMIATIIYGSLYTYFSQAVSAAKPVQAQVAYRNDMILSLLICVIPIILLACTPRQRLSKEAKS